MIKWLSKFLDNASEFLAHRKGLLPLVGIGLIIVNFLIVSIFSGGFLVETNLFLHLGLVVALLGLVLAWAL
jgi:hypothetical protein